MGRDRAVLTLSASRTQIFAALLAVAGIGALAAAPTRAHAATKPNIIVITDDDQRQDDLSIMTKVKSQLGASGVTFDNSFASYSLCCPSRTTFMTGQYMHNHGVTWNFYPQGGYFKFKHSTNFGGWGNVLPAWLQTAGYHTGLIGKYLNQTGEADPATTTVRGATGTAGSTTITVDDASDLKVGDRVQGHYSKVSASGSGGANTVTVSDASNIHVGDYGVGAGFGDGPLTVTGISGKTVTFSGNLAANTDTLLTVRPGIAVGSKVTNIVGTSVTLSYPLEGAVSGSSNIETQHSNPSEIPPGWNEWVGGVDPTTYAYYGYTLNVNGRLVTYGKCRHEYRVIDDLGVSITPPLPTPYTKDANEGCHEEFKGASDTYLQNGATVGLKPTDKKAAAVDKNYQSDVLATYAEKYIAANGKKSKPYFLWVTPTAPHTTTLTGGNEGSPAIPPFRYSNLFADKAFPQSPSYNEIDVSDKPCIQSFFCWFPLMGSNTGTDADRKLKENFDKLVTAHYRGRQRAVMGVDDLVGRIVAAVKKTGKQKNTLIMFTSDNGWLLGEHRIVAQKQFGFDESIRVPLVISGPGFTGGKHSTPMVTNTDLAPTILRAAGATAGRPQDGVALQDVIADPAHWLDRTLVIETGENPRAPYYDGIHNRRFHLEILHGGGLPVRYELYDLSKDPYEMNAVQDDPAYAGVLASLIAQDQRLHGCSGSNCNDLSAIPASPAHSSLDDVSLTTGLHTGP